ncbi:carboxy-S-adenosyl-L-methionine synthase CmoA [Chromatiales bacterium (ex Bugula neritina AB1)]|nr:carboxy-S-adenosyl-L-methionine synthase CmoA [Chromatiales bacterium (ex Bugula neritina AB1)]
MSRDEVFVNDIKRTSDFVFNREVVEVFDDMLARSIPLYEEQQNLIREIARRFWVPETSIADLGCSLGTTLLGIAEAVPEAGTLVGYDNSDAMLDRARSNIESAGKARVVAVQSGDLNGDLKEVELINTSVVTICWTLQFVRPLKRDQLIRKIYNTMVDGGVLIVTDKVLTNDSNMNRFFIDFYYDFKRRNGYSEAEITRKREALENVLIPYRLDENIELFRRNGFQIVETFFQWNNFAGFLCVKSS